MHLFGLSADSCVYLSVALQGPPPAIFPFTLPDSSVGVAQRSLTCNTAMLRQTAATRKSSHLTIHRRSSPGRLWIPFALGTSWQQRQSTSATHRSAKKRSTTICIAPNFPFCKPWRRCFLTLTLSATSSATQVYTALAPSGITIARSSGVAIACSKWQSLSLAVFDFRRLRGWSDTWRTDLGYASVRSPDIRPPPQMISYTYYPSLSEKTAFSQAGRFLRNVKLFTVV